MESEGGEPLLVPPIARLPVELLTHIIDIIARDPHYHDWDRYLPDVSIAISHVCRFWRDAALGPGGKMLWRYVPLRHSAACVRAFMERSHPLMVFLKIEIEVPFMPMSLTALAEAVTYMDRVSGMSFKSTHNYEWASPHAIDQLHHSIYGILTSKPAPSLETLDWTEWHIEYYPQDSSPPISILPSNLFARQTPNNLRILKILGVGLAFDHTLLRASLTCLEFQDCKAWETVDELLDTLSCMPALEQLTFNYEDQRLGERYVGESQLSQAYSQRSINLPRLHTLKLLDMQLDLPAIILFYLRLPAYTHIQIYLAAELDEYGYGTSDEDVSLLRDALEAHYSANVDDRTFVISAISIENGGARGNGFQVTLSACHNHLQYLSVTLAQLYDFYTWSKETMMTVANQFLGISILSTATRLNVSHSEFFTIGRAADWLALRTSVPNLEAIVISRDALHGLCPALLAPPDIESGITLFPKLSHLCFQNIDFDEDTYYTTFSLVASILIVRHRLRHGYPIKRIEFFQCSGARKLADDLSAALPDTDVVWEGRE